MSRGRRIGRIKFLPPSTTTAQKYLFDWDNKELFNAPENFPKISREYVFGLAGLIHLEIGCGTGEFLCNQAQENSELSFIGIDISRRAIYHAIHFAKQQKLNNIKFIKADFKLLYPLLLPNSLDMVYLHFPDPNYGKQYTKHRIVDQIFLDHLYPALSANGSIDIITDQKPFLDDIINIFVKDGNFSKISAPALLTENNPEAMSRFHQAWLRHNRQIYQIQIQK